jgi:hypothetical protein
MHSPPPTGNGWSGWKPHHDRQDGRGTSKGVGSNVETTGVAKERGTGPLAVWDLAVSSDEPPNPKTQRTKGIKDMVEGLAGPRSPRSPVPRNIQGSRPPLIGRVNRGHRHQIDIRIGLEESYRPRHKDLTSQTNNGQRSGVAVAPGPRQRDPARQMATKGVVSLATKK